MRTRLWIAVLAAFTLAALLPLIPASAGDNPEEPKTAPVLPPDEEQHAKILAALKTSEKEKKEDLLLACLVEMAGIPNADGGVRVALKHKDYEPHIKRGLKSKNEDVKRLAILAAATHEMKDEAKALTKLLKKKPKKGKAFSPTIAAAIVEFVNRMDIKGHEKRIFEDHLEPIHLDEKRIRRSASKTMLRAGIHYMGKTKYKPAVKWLIMQIKKPEPENPNSPSNPPASYWKARYTLWQGTEGWVRWALLEITGEKFRSHREWKAWYARNEKKYEK